MRSLYIDGTGFLYRTNIKLKLVSLFAIGAAIFISKSILILTIVFIFGGILYFSISQSFIQAIQRLIPIFLTIVLVAFFSFLVGTFEQAALQLLRLTSLMLLAATITATTKIGDFVQAITDFSKPIERMGLGNAEDIGLALGLVLRFVPEILTRYEAIRDAHKARGLKLRMFTILPSLIILTLQQADQIAQAIDARNLR
ncbi:energy-coupling factor transporter transmembrane protein EcfT [Ochrobactrum sp. Marseille-Q0166]|uniref:CbiQ family ECF transporter T component n=1 Tax=Ochrobactrum sp. Marseille-Q0166 TaxID=2761105 RepID=UPI001654FCB1|nr:energy-coupling factor transporter transmembrane protein EcfT [Ochrobactrum sp. Marseille-Q0166]